MKKFLYLVPIVFGLTILPLFAIETTKHEETKPSIDLEKDISKISNAFGHIIGQNLTSLGLDFKMSDVIQGIQDSTAGKESPMNESECIQAISMMQEASTKKQGDMNLQKAEEFLSKNKKEKGVIEIEEGKLQYIRLQEGFGEEVKADFSPVIRYIGTLLDGKTFGESSKDEVIVLNETIPGFNKSIVGMKEGEKRKVFIHPDFGYGTMNFLPPNSLLTFEIEVIKANAPKVEESAASVSKNANQVDEIASTEDTPQKPTNK